MVLEDFLFTPIHPYFCPSILVFTRPNDGWTLPKAMEVTHLVIFVLLSDGVKVAPYWPFYLDFLSSLRYPINELRQRLQQLAPLFCIRLEATPGGRKINMRSPLHVAGCLIECKQIHKCSCEVLVLGN